MSQDTITTLIIGGAIGFLFSFITNIIAFRFQLYRDKEAKKWEQEKQYQEEGVKIINARLATLEIEVLGVMENIMLAGNAFSDYFNGASDFEPLTNFQEKYLVTSVNQMPKILPKVFYFKDIILRWIIEDIVKLVSSYSNHYKELIKFARENDEEGVEQVINNIRELQLEFTDVSGRFLTRIDMLKIDAVEQFKKIKKSDEAMNQLRKEHKKRERRDEETNRIES